MSQDTLTITGGAAELRWGSAPAASLGAWGVTGSPGAWKFTAEIRSTHPFRIAQTPLKVVVSIKKPDGTTGTWIWNVDSMAINGTSLVATVSPRDTSG